MKILSKDDNFKEIINNDLVLVDIFANWCGPCKMLIPVLEELSSKYNIVKVNVDEFEELAREYGIMSIPTLYLFKNGEVIAKTIGYKDKEEIESWITSKI